MFGEQFLNALMLRQSDRDLDLIKILAQTGREFWINMILWHVFTHPKADTKYVKDLIFALELQRDSRQSTIDFTSIATAISKRQANRTTNDATELLSVVYSRIHLFSESKSAVIYPSAMAPATSLAAMAAGDPCAALLVEIDKKYSDINGGESILR